jgi:nicotinamidase-related amidase
LDKAILVIDAQYGLLAGPDAVYEASNLVQRIKTLLSNARVAGLPIFYMQDKDVGPLDSQDWQIHPDIAPHQSDIVIRKAYADSFYETPLHSMLSKQSVRQLVLVGCKTDACVEMTCRRAISLGYDVLLVGDGHSTTDNRFMTAAQSIAYYNVSLDGFGAEDGFGNGEHEVRIVAAAEIEF